MFSALERNEETERVEKKRGPKGDWPWSVTYLGSGGEERAQMANTGVDEAIAEGGRFG